MKKTASKNPLKSPKASFQEKFVGTQSSLYIPAIPRAESSPSDLDIPVSCPSPQITRSNEAPNKFPQIRNPIRPMWTQRTCSRMRTELEVTVEVPNYRWELVPIKFPLTHGIELQPSDVDCDVEWGTPTQGTRFL